MRELFEKIQHRLSNEDIMNLIATGSEYFYGFDELSVYCMNEIDEIFYGYPPIELLSFMFNSNISLAHEYFHFDSTGYITSIADDEYLKYFFQDNLEYIFDELTWACETEKYPNLKAEILEIIQPYLDEIE